MKKCDSCGKTVSNRDIKCPYCGDAVDQKVYCPKCHSTNVTFKIKQPGVIKIILIFLFIPRLWAYKMAEKESFIYVCNDCRKKFNTVKNIK